MYRKMDSAAQRASEIKAIKFQLDVLEGLAGGPEQGPYLAGRELTAADAALFPTFVFMTAMLPRYFGWKDVFARRPKLHNWYSSMLKDDVGLEVGGWVGARGSRFVSCPGNWVVCQVGDNILISHSLCVCVCVCS